MSLLEDLHHALGGDLARDEHGEPVWRGPGPNHSRDDRSLQVRLDPERGFRVQSFSPADDDPAVLRDYVAKVLNRPAWEPKSKANGKRPPKATGKPRWRRYPSITYPYPEADGVPFLRVCRTNPKGFFQEHSDDGGKTWKQGGIPDARQVPYQLPKVLAAIKAGVEVYVVEGEKDVITLERRGLVATTNAGGAGKWWPSLTPHLQGARVIILPDNDEPGRLHAQKVKAALEPVAASVRIVNLPGLREHGDVTDWIKSRNDPATIIDLPDDPQVTHTVTTTPAEVSDTTTPSWETPRPDLWARPFILRDPASIAPRQHLYGHLLTRKFVSATIGAPGVGKTTLGVKEAVACATGRPLLGVTPTARLRTWFYNGEDPADETERQVAAVAIQHGLTRADLEGWLFTGSGRDHELVLAHETRDGATVYAPVEQALVGMIRALRLDVVSVDPFVSSHHLTENDAGAIDLVCKAWGRIAEVTNVAVHLAHHPRKGSGGDLTVEDARGSSALVAAARHVRLLNPMTKEEAQTLGVERPRAFFRTDHGKASFFPPAEAAEWYRLEGVCLENGGPLGLGDNVGVVVPWQPANPFQGVTVQHLYAVQRRIHDEGSWRASDQAEGWAGQVVADVLRLNIGDKQERQKVARILAHWEREGLFGREERTDPKDRKKRPFLTVKRWTAL